jgi:hypothetical protein
MYVSLRFLAHDILHWNKISTDLKIQFSQTKYCIWVLDNGHDAKSHVV